MRSVARLAIVSAVWAWGCHGTDGDLGRSAHVCYYTPEGAPALTESSEAWFVPWMVPRGGTRLPREYPYAQFLTPVAGEGGIGVYLGDALAGSRAPLCVRLLYKLEYGRADSYQIAVYAKIRGFSPVVTYPTSGDDPVWQVIAAISEEEDTSQLCSSRIGAPETCELSGSVVGPDGAAVTGPAGLPFWLAISPQPKAGIGLAWAGPPQPDGRFAVQASDPSVVLLHASGYLPSIQCLACGDHVVQLESAPSTYDPSGCSAGAGLPRSPTLALVAGLLAIARRRGVRGPNGKR
jgi:hypothetical protein